MREFQRFEIIEALAGSGKTQELTYRYLRLVAMGADPKTILATTFSRKAAGEIRDRIIELLAESVLDLSSFEELLAGVPEIEDGQAGCELILRQLVANMHRLNIGTIDSFFVKTAQSFSDALGLTPNWSILDEVHEANIFAEAVVRLTQDSSKKQKLAKLLRWSKSAAKVSIASTLNGLQRQAFSSVRDAKKDAWLWGSPLPTLGSEDFEGALLTLEQVKLEHKSQQNDLPKAMAKLQSENWSGFLKSGMAAKVLDQSFVYFSKKLDSDVVQALQPLVDHALGVMANRIRNKNRGTYELMHELHACWVSAKHDQGLYSFDDVTYYLSHIRLMEELLELQFRMDSSIDHMLIDEFQDTSLAQWSVLEPLIDEIHQSDNDRSLFFVGDVKQSLYGFRGGEPALLRQLHSRLEGSKTIALEKSWRCSSPVLHAVNTIFEHIHDVPLLVEHAPNAASEWLKDFTHHLSARPDRRGYAVVQTAGVDPENRKSTLDLCIEKVTDIVAKIHTKTPNATIGILVRSNTKQQIQRIVHSLRTNQEHAVLAAEFGGNPLTDSTAVTVILSALLMVDNPGNTIARFHVCSSLLGEFLGITFFDSDRTLDKTCRSIRRRLLQGGYAKVISTFAEQFIDTVDTRDRLRLWQLVEFAETHAGDTSLRPSEFVSIIQETQVPDPASAKVQVMTIHKSKGLSFDAVVVCDLDQQIWKTPSRMEYHDDPCKPPVCVGMYASEYLDAALPEYRKMRKELHEQQVNDAMCLLYVAMTRAKHALHLVIPSRSNKQHLKKLDGLLLQILGEPQMQDPDKIVWIAEGSDPKWYEDIAQDTYEESVQKIDQFKIGEKPTGQYDDARGVTLTAPSKLEGGGKVNIGQQFSGDTAVAFGWGTVVHYWLEQIEWLDAIPTNEELISTAPVELAMRLGDSTIAAAANMLSDALQSDHLKLLLAIPPSSVAVYNEQKFAVRVPGGTKLGQVELHETTDIHGSIDRLVVHRDENGEPISADVVDWKTDVFQPDELEDKVAHYAPQLASYRVAAAKLLGIAVEDVTALLVFVKTGMVVDSTNEAAVSMP